MQGSTKEQVRLRFWGKEREGGMCAGTFCSLACLRPDESREYLFAGDLKSIEAE